jgi:pilus assembly protein Flp/PilA
VPFALVANNPACLSIVNDRCRTIAGMRLLLRRKRLDEGGATAIEYALVALLISIVILSGVQTIGGWVSSTFLSVANDM